MSNKVNHRRKHQKKRSECAHLRTWASWGGTQGAAKGRRRYKALRNRSARRTGGQTPGIGIYRSRPIVLPEIVFEEMLDEVQLANRWEQG